MAFDRHLNVINDHISDERAMKGMSQRDLVSWQRRAALHKERMDVAHSAHAMNNPEVGVTD
jgi:hypothetical protein